MLRRKILVIIMSLSLLVSICGMISCTIATDVTNHFVSGFVDIQLQDSNVEALQSIMPGSTLPRTPRIFNSGNDCYVRAKITTSGLNARDLSLIRVDGFSNRWVKADDGYYYYLDVLPHGQSTSLFQRVCFPAEISPDSQGKTLYVDLTVDAIQSKNFEPQFDTASPWGNIEILKYEKEVRSFKQSDTQTFQVIYKGSAAGLVTNSDDFFVNFPYLMPGDTYSDTAHLVNDGERAINLYFRSVATDSSELLDKITLKIVANNKLFYEGPLRATALSDNDLLCVLPAGTETNFDFSIHVPAELNNKYTLLSSDVTWIFSTEVIDTTTLPTPPTPATGEGWDFWIYVGMFIVSTISLLYVIIEKRENK